jgi:hypothetical protein
LRRLGVTDLSTPIDGLWLSLVERLVRDEEAVGSNPTSPIFFCYINLMAEMRRSVLGSVGGIDIGTEHKPAIRKARDNYQVLIESQLPVCGIRYGLDETC